MLELENPEEFGKTEKTLNYLIKECEVTREQALMVIIIDKITTIIKKLDNASS